MSVKERKEERGRERGENGREFFFSSSFSHSPKRQTHESIAILQVQMEFRSAHLSFRHTSSWYVCLFMCLQWLTSVAESRARSCLRKGDAVIPSSARVKSFIVLNGWTKDQFEDEDQTLHLMHNRRRSSLVIYRSALFKWPPTINADRKRHVSQRPRYVCGPQTTYLYVAVVMQPLTNYYKIYRDQLHRRSPRSPYMLT